MRLALLCAVLLVGCEGRIAYHGSPKVIHYECEGKRFANREDARNHCLSISRRDGVQHPYQKYANGELIQQYVCAVPFRRAVREADCGYEAKVVRVVDGDTVELDVRLGFGVTIREMFRLSGINAPEKRGATRAAGLAAEAHLKKLLGNGDVRINTVRTRKGKDKKGKFGRYLCRIVKGGIDINKQMVVDGHAEEY